MVYHTVIFRNVAVESAIRPVDISGDLHNPLKQKDLTGEWTDGFFVMTRGDSRIAMTITKDKYTSKFNRESRFLIDDYDSEDVLAYRLTKPMKVGGTYGELDNTNGVFKFVLSECNREDDDNIELHIADYYNSYPKEKNKDAPEGKKVWI